MQATLNKRVGERERSKELTKGGIDACERHLFDFDSIGILPQDVTDREVGFISQLMYMHKLLMHSEHWHFPLLLHQTICMSNTDLVAYAQVPLIKQPTVFSYKTAHQKNDMISAKIIQHSRAVPLHKKISQNISQDMKLASLMHRTKIKRIIIKKKKNHYHHCAPLQFSNL